MDSWKCHADDCESIATFGKNKDERTHCWEHRNEEMIMTFSKECVDEISNLKNKKQNKCVYKSCTKNAGYNFYGVKVRLFCKLHKLIGMVDVAHPRCPCEKHCRPSYGFPEDKATHCVDCKTEGMMDVVHDKCGCEKNIRASIGYPGEKPSCCKACKKEGMINVVDNKCACDRAKVPGFGFPGSTATCCKDCKIEGMINVVSKRCKCALNKLANFGQPNGEVVCCKDCKEDGMINLNIKRCDCLLKNAAIYGYPDEMETCCKACKKEGMIYLHCTRCKCEKNHIAHFGYPDEKAICCSSCKNTGMIDLVHKFCKCELRRRPNFGYDGELPTCCVKCKSENMIDFYKKCECGERIPTFGYPEEIKICCKTCKKPGMIYISTTQCSCILKKQPIFGYKDGKPVCCIACKEEDMIDLKHNICKSSFCDNQARYAKYNDYCFICFINLFPNNEIVRNYKIKERYFTDFVEVNFPKKFTFDRRINGGCSLRRPDMYLDLITHTLHGELDENQHKPYDTTCEEAKINDTFTDNADRFMVLIRVNPDGYVDKNGKRHESCFKIHQKNGALIVRDDNDLYRRLNKLKERLEYWMHNIPNELMTIEYHFYDGY